MNEQEIISSKLDDFHTVEKNTLLHVECLKNLKRKLTHKYLKGDV